MRGVGRENYSIYTWETDQTPQRKGRLPGRCKKHIGHAPSRAKLRRGQRNIATLEQGRQNTNLKSWVGETPTQPARRDYKRHMSKTSPERRLRELLPSRIRHEERQGDRPLQLPALRELEGSTERRTSPNCVGIPDGHPPEKKGALSLYEPPKSAFYIRSEVFNPPQHLRPTPKRATSKIRKRSLF